MKNRFFQTMQRKGIAYRKQIAPLSINPYNKLYSHGASVAYMYWAISEQYNATDIYIDELPDENTIIEMLDTFRAAGISTFVVAIGIKTDILEMHGCKITNECKVYRRETELYYGNLEILKGVRVMLN